MKNSTRLWLKGLASAAIGGAAHATVNMAIAPETFNLQAGLPKLASAALVSGIIAAAFYLKSSPIPPEDDLDYSPPKAAPQAAPAKPA